MGSIGKIISVKIGNYITAVISRKLGQNKEGSFFGTPGIDAPPLPDDKHFMTDRDGKGRMAFIGNLMISQGAKAGEMIIYSRDSSGAVKGKIYVNEDGEIVINDGDTPAARWGDSTQLLMSGTDIQVLATALLATGAFVPSGSAPIPSTPVLFEDGEITDGTEEVLLP